MRHILLTLVIAFGVSSTSTSGFINMLARTSKSLVEITIDLENELNSTSNIIVPSIPENSNVLFAANTKEKTVFYLSDKKLFAINLDTRQNEEIGDIGGYLIDSPSAIDYDWITDKIYLGVQGNHESSGRIDACSLTNISSCTVVQYEKLDYLYSLVVNPNEGKMFWQSGVTNKVEMSSMNGEDHERTPFIGLRISQSAIFRSLYFHYESNRLFFIKSDRNNHEIIGCYINSTSYCQTVMRAFNIVNFAVSEKHLLWSVSVHGTLMYCEISNCEKTMKKSVFNGIENFIVIRQKFTNVDNKCNNGCSDFCLLGSKPKCACPIGVSLDHDKLTCNKRGNQKAMFVSSLNGIFKISLDTNDFAALPHRYQEESVTKTEDIEYDPINRILYWIEDEIEEKSRNTVRYLKRSGIEDTEKIESLVQLPLTVRKIRFESDANNMFWMDDASPTRVGVTSLTSMYSKTVIYGSLMNIKSYALYRSERRIIIARDGEKSGVIEKFDLFGTKVKTLYTLPSGCFVTDLNIDNTRNILFWIESQSSDLVWLNLKHQGIVTRIPFDPIYRLTQPSMLEIMGSTVFINSLIGRSILKVSTDNIAVPLSKSIETPIFGARGMKSVNFEEEKPSQNPCRMRNGECDHICMPVMEKGRSCECADGYHKNSIVPGCSKFDEYGLLHFEDNTLSLLPNKEYSIPQYLLSDQYITSIKAVDYNLAKREIISAGLSVEGLPAIAKISIPPPSEAGQLSSFIKSEITISDESLNGIFDICVDHISGNIYWTNSISEQIEVSDGTGKYRKILSWNQIKPRNIVIHVPEKMVIFYDYNHPKAIKKMPMRGDPMGGIEIVENLNHVLSLSIDSENNQIYWIEVHDSWILCTADLEGSNRELLYVGKDKKPIALSLLHGIPYFVENDEFDLGKLGFYNGKVMKTLSSNFKKVTDVKMIDQKSSLTSSERNSNCYETNSDCDHLCLVEKETTTLMPFTIQSPYREFCTCADHFEFSRSSISSETRQCREFQHKIILVKPDGIFQIGLRRIHGSFLTWKHDPIIRLPIKWSVYQIPTVLSYYPNGRLIFWIDNKNSTHILYANLDTGKVFSSSAESTNVCRIFYSLAVDVIGNQLFATCYRDMLGYIALFHITENPAGLKFIDLITTSHSIESDSVGFQPRDIAVFPLRNMLFYVDASNYDNTNSTKIIKCSLDGKRCSIWLENNVDSHSRLAVDPNIDSSRLFYTNKMGVWSRDVASSESNIYHHYGSFSATNEYSVAPIDEHSILIADKSASGSIVYDWPSKHAVFDLNGTFEMFRSANFEIQSKICQSAQCSHICRYVRDKDAPLHKKYECLCPIGMTINPENERSCKSSVTCQAWQFTCVNGRQCVHAGKKCDGVNDCSDHSDESFMMCKSKSIKDWPCDDGNGFVNRSLVCDGFPHCPDASDELHCRCERPFESFDCGAWSQSGSLKCIPRISICDRVNDCEQGEDERSMICHQFGTLFPDEAKWLYLLLLLIVLLLLFLLIVFCCARSDKQASQNISRATTSHTQETRQLIRGYPPSHPPSHLALNSVAYSVSNGSSSCVALPPPNSEQSLAFDVRMHRCYAPPPSTESISTYGVVRPSDIKFNQKANVSKRFQKSIVSSSDDDVPRTSTPRNYETSTRSRHSQKKNRPPPLPFTPISNTRKVDVDLEPCCNQNQSRYLDI